MAIKTQDIRNVALLGHGDSGKSSLAEAILFFTKNTDRHGKIPEGTTVSDYDQEEIRRTYSIQTSLISFPVGGTKINLLDAPGFFDFAGEAKQAVRVADTALIVINSHTGIDVGSEFSVEYAEEAAIPKVFFVNKLDGENLNFDDLLSSLREKFGVSVCPAFVPYIENGLAVGYINVLTQKYYTYDKTGAAKESAIPAAFADKAAEYKGFLFETLAGTDDALMEKYFADEPFTDEEALAAMKSGIASGAIAPVYSGSSITLAGIDSITDAIVKYFPNPLARATEKIADGDGYKDAKIDETGNTSLFVFKTVADPFVGKMSYFKVMNGLLKRDMTLNNLSGGHEKFSHLYTLRGKKQTEADDLACGDIGVTAKLNATNTNDTLTASGGDAYKPIVYPEPFLTYAIIPKAKGDEDKIGTGINKLLEEDRTIKYENSAETHQMLISGLGEIHIDVITSKLKNRFGISVEFQIPRMAYRETIKKKIFVEGKHKKQSGGHGQYGHVKIEFSPCDDNDGLTFVESVFGGSVPKQFHPAVEKGLHDCMSHGVLAGFPCVHIKADLKDGSYHDVDSNEMSFKMAASLAFKELKNANPVLLEPVGLLKVSVPENFVGDIMGDLNKRRGRVLGMNASETKKGYTVIEAEVPLAEMQTYTIQLRATTQGRGYYECRFARYEELPAALTPKVIEEAAKFKAEEE
ncbi:elongation factor G [Clostridia bacterium]|nr:elongation factor G [Clostridia bacterium]